VVVWRPGPPLGRLVREISYRAGEQAHASVEKILPSPDTGLWVNLNRDEFRSFASFAEGGQVSRVPGAMLSGAASRARVIAATRHGYADQPHLADEFRALADVTPGEYLRSRIDGPNHLRVLPGGVRFIPGRVEPGRVESSGPEAHRSREPHPHMMCSPAHSASVRAIPRRVYRTPGRTGIRRECPSHAHLATWLRHPHRIGRVTAGTGEDRVTWHA
jgi:hypothetical protein